MSYLCFISQNFNYCFMYHSTDFFILSLSYHYLVIMAFALMIMIYHENIFCLFKAVAVHCKSCRIDSSTVNIN